MIGWIHSTEIVWIVCGLNEGAHFVIFDIVEVRDAVESCHHRVDGFVYKYYDALHVHFDFVI